MTTNKPTQRPTSRPTPKPRNTRATAYGPVLYGDLDEVLYGYPERPGVRRNPLRATRVG